MYASSLIALVGLGLALWRPRVGVARDALLKGGLCALLVVDLVSFGRGYNPSLPINWLFPRNRITDFLQEAHGPLGVTALNQDLITDAQIMFGLPDVRGLDYPTRWCRSCQHEPKSGRPGYRMGSSCPRLTRRSSGCST
jgi:hypothetical protein